MKLFETLVAAKLVIFAFTNPLLSEPIAQEIDARNIVISNNGVSFLLDTQVGRIVGRAEIADPIAAMEYFSQIMDYSGIGLAREKIGIEPYQNKYINIMIDKIDSNTNVIEQLNIIQSIANEHMIKEELSNNKNNINVDQKEIKKCTTKVIQERRKKVMSDALANGSNIFDGIIGLKMIAAGVKPWEIDGKIAELKQNLKAEKEANVQAEKAKFRIITLLDSGRSTEEIEMDKQDAIDVDPIQPLDVLMGGAIAAARNVGAGAGVVVSSAIRGAATKAGTQVGKEIVINSEEFLNGVNKTVKESAADCEKNPGKPFCKW